MSLFLRTEHNCNCSSESLGLLALPCVLPFLRFQQQHIKRHVCKHLKIYSPSVMESNISYVVRGEYYFSFKVITTVNMVKDIGVVFFVVTMELNSPSSQMTTKE